MPDLIQLLREQTFQNALDVLEAHHKCAIIRPTGYGKTCILTQFFDLYKKMYKYKKIVYLYPNDITYTTALNFYFDHKIPKNPIIPNVRFISYHKLIRMSNDEFKELSDTELIITDECHKLGASETKRAFKRMIKILSDAHLLGATATPDRSDLIDIIDMFFDGHTTTEYTLHDAFQDNILKKPFYCYCTYKPATVVQDVEKQTRLNIIDNNQASENLLRSRLIEISNLLDMHNIIKKTCDQYAKDTDYLKFIIFFSNFNHLHEKEDTVRQWFQDAYPTHRVNTLVITSESKEDHDNLKELQKMYPKKQHIDLIFCCDMLNLGYHVDDITGIGMYRGTNSNTIYIQQLGRALNSGYSGIVFDWVDNLHRASIYEVLGKRSKKSKEKRARYDELKYRLTINDPNDQLTDQEEKEYKKLDAVFGRTNRWYLHANDLEPADLIPTEHMAKYRELIAKTIAEPISMRCRQAYASWKEHGGDDSVKTRAYILGQTGPDKHPLDIYALWKQVSINAILDEMGIKD